MFVEIIIAIVLGIIAGIFTGLTPGIHVNLVSLILLSVSPFFLQFTSPLVLGVFIISMAVTHTFLDAIPSIFLGAPDADMALGVLPGHRLLLEGRGFEAVKLTVIGSLLALIGTVALIPLVIPFVPEVYGFIQPYVGYILIVVVIYIILIETGWVKKLWSLLIFLLSGVLGLITLHWNNFKDPLFPLLSGLFGISTLLLSLNEKTVIPKQKITETIKVGKAKTAKAVVAAVVSGSIAGLLPGIGSAEAALLGMVLVGEIGSYAFMILIGGINGVNFIFSLASLYTLERARNGAIVVVLELMKKITAHELVIFLATALVAGAAATYITLKISKKAAALISKINYRKLCIGVIAFVTGMVIFFSHFYGLLVLLVSTSIGMIAPLVNVKRSHAMGVLLLPIILFFVL